MGIFDAVRRAALVHVYAGDVSGDADDESVGLFHAVKRCAGTGCHGGGSGGVRHYAERTGAAAAGVILSDGKCGRKPRPRGCLV